jgi:hypothetical protein
MTVCSHVTSRASLQHLFMIMKKNETSAESFSLYFRPPDESHQCSLPIMCAAHFAAILRTYKCKSSFSRSSSLTSTMVPCTESCFACFTGTLMVMTGAASLGCLLRSSSASQHCSSRAARRSPSYLAFSWRRSAAQKASVNGLDSGRHDQDLASMKIRGSLEM